MKLKLQLLLFVIIPGVLGAQISSDTNLIKEHLTAITKTTDFRHYLNIDQLNATAEYIKKEFECYADTSFFQEYVVDDKGYFNEFSWDWVTQKGDKKYSDSIINRTFKNVICSFGPVDAPRIIIGAHYDVCGEQEGADDNASGVVGLLELARMLKGKELEFRVDLVAYSLEEPPFFRTQYMGSHIHAKSLKEDSVDVTGMISLEMIGFFKEEKHTQDYPIKLLSLFYGKRGNYITLIKKTGSKKFAKRFSRKFKATKTLRTKKFTAPPSLPGIDFSDHLNYWEQGYSALMITDTAFMRNKNYHEHTDTMETLDVAKMAKVIDGIFQALLSY